MTVRYTPSAWATYQDALSTIHAHNRLAAYRFAESVERAVARLQRFPQLGHYIPEFPDSPHRQFIVGPYRFFYRLDEETIWIVSVWHGAQIPAEPVR